MKVLITGGSGFIGTRILERLRDDHEIVLFDNLLPQVHANNDDLRLRAIDANLVIGDVRDKDLLSRTVRDFNPDLVYHLAADTGTGQSFDEIERYTQVNVMGTCHLIEAVRAHGSNTGRIVLAGSRSVYGEGACLDSAGRASTALPRSEVDLRAGLFSPRNARGEILTPVATHADCPVQPASVYASTKLMQEYLLRQAFWGTGVDVGILRLQNVYGPGQSLDNPYTGVISIFARQIDRGRRLNIFEDGQITRDFVFVEDVAAAFEAIGLAETCPTASIDIGSGTPVTILELAQKLLTRMGHPSDRLDITGDFRPGDIRHALADISAAADLLNWSPTVSIDQGLDRFVTWAFRAADLHQPCEA